MPDHDTMFFFFYISGATVFHAEILCHDREAAARGERAIIYRL